MPSGDDDEIVARCGLLPGFGEGLAGVRLLVELFVARFAGERVLGELLTGEFFAGRTFLE